MPKIFVSKKCVCNPANSIANNYNYVPPRAANKSNTYVAGTFNLQFYKTPTQVKRDSVIKPKETITAPGVGRTRHPRSIYYPPRGMNLYRKKLRCPPLGGTCDASANVTDIYKDPLSQCSTDTCYEHVIKSVINVKGKNPGLPDLSGNATLTPNQTLVNKRYVHSYTYGNGIQAQSGINLVKQSTDKQLKPGNHVDQNCPPCESSVPVPSWKNTANLGQNGARVYYNPGAVSSGSRIEKLKYNTIKCTPRDKAQDRNTNQPSTFKMCGLYRGTQSHNKDITKKPRVCDVPATLARVRQRKFKEYNNSCTKCTGPCS